MHFKFKSFFKLIFIFLVFLVAHNVSATTYYVDATGGSNTNNGTSTGTAWQTVGKIGATTLSPGDIVLFKKGETFNGKLTPGQSGTAGNLITFGAYGTGANPIINASGQTYGIDIQSRSYLRFENLTVQNATTGQVLSLGTQSNLQFDSVTLSGGVYGVYTLSGTQTSLSFSNVTISGFSSSAFELSNTINTISISNSTISSGSIGINATAAITGLSISNTTFSSLTSTAINFSSASTATNLSLSNVTASGSTGGAGVFMQGNISTASITNSNFNSNASSGIKIQPASSKTVSNFTISDTSTLSNTGYGINFGGSGSGSTVTLSGITSTGNSSNGFLISRTWNGVSISNSTFSSNSSDGLQFYLDNVAASITNVTLNNVTANNNNGSGYQFLGTSGSGSLATLTNVTSNSNHVDGINVKGNWTGVDIVGCISNTNGVDGSSGDGDGISYHNSTTGSIKYCFVSNNIKSAVAHVGDSDLDMSYNIFRHDTVGTLTSLVYLEGTGTYNMYNNTIYSAGQTGSGVDISTPTGPTLTFKNNIIYGFANGFKYTAGTLTEDYNLIYHTGTANYSGVTAGTHSISADPLFTNAGSNDFTLQSGSPAVDAGVTISATYDDALHPNTVFVSSVNTLDQDLRGSGWELGAYIYPVPQAPTIGSVEVLGDSSLKFNFTDNSSDETGFKLYSNADTLVTTDATTNLSSINATSLASNTGFSGYYIKAYNSYGNSIASSGSSIAYTLAPTPTSISTTINSGDILLSTTSLNNDTINSSGYYFENTTNSTNSGWIQTSSWTNNSLSCSTPYSYSIKYRNQEGTETSVYTTTLNTAGCSRYGSYSPSFVSYVPPKTIPIIDSSVGSIKVNGGDKMVCNIPNVDFNKFIFSKKILKFGSRGEDVKILQSCLSSYGVDIYPAGIINGVFGPQTKQAIKNFQNKYSLKSDGIVGPKFKKQMELLK